MRFFVVGTEVLELEGGGELKGEREGASVTKQLPPRQVTVEVGNGA